jgi:hypothetical protein
MKFRLLSNTIGVRNKLIKPYSGMWRHVAVVSEELIAYIIRIERISELATTLAVCKI